MNVVGVLLLGLFTSVVALILTQIKSEYASLCTLCGGIIIFLCALSNFTTVFEFLGNLWAKAQIDDRLLEIVIKILGISILTEFTISICNDHHHSLLSSATALLSRIIILILALPIFEDVVTLLEEMLI